MAITWAQVIAIAPEATDVAATAQTIILGLTGKLVSADTWGLLVDEAQIYMAAHLGTLTGWGGSGGGPVTSESLGPMSRSYANVASSYASMGVLGSTKYGMIYLSLFNSLEPAMFVP